jgi:lipoprotein-releasing system permease protein
MALEWKIALRFLKAGKGQSVFILLGISIGVSVMIFLNTLISGLQEDLINQTVGTSPHIIITASDKTLASEITNSDVDNRIFAGVDKSLNSLDGWEQIVQVLESNQDITDIAPVALGNGFYQASGKANPIQIKGWSIEQSDGIYNIKESITLGTSNLQGNSILVGNKFLEDNELSLGDVIPLSAPGKSNESYTITGVFDLGSNLINESWVIMDIKRASKFLGLGNNISAIEIQVTEVFDAIEIDEKISNRLSGVKVSNWIDNNGSLLSALQSQSYSSIMIQVFVLLAITLGISSVLAVSVVQKSKQLGILKAMGTKGKQASRIFLLQGGMLGTIGAGLGAILGAILIQGFLFGTSAATGDPLFPLKISIESIAVIGSIAIISSTIAAFIPANKSSKLNPVEVIRNG